MSAKGVIGGVVGAIGGFMIGGPAGAVVGFAVGMGVGMAMDATTADAPDTPGMGQIHAMDITTAELGDPLPDFVGTVKIAGNIIQSWGHRVEELTEQQSSPGAKGGGGGESSQTVVVGYKNYLSFCLALAYGPDPVSTVHAILFDDKVVWYGELTDDDDDGEESISLGSESGEDLGSAVVYFGSSDQVANAKVGAALSDPTLNTAYRGQFYIFFDDVMIGGYARAPSIKVVASKFPSIAAIGDESLSIVNEVNYNPSFAMWYLMEKYAGIDTSFLNTTSFSACATYFHDMDYIGVSIFINRYVLVESYIEGIMSHCGMSLVEKEGEIHLGILRDDVDESAMESITDDMVSQIPSLTIGSWEDTFNDIKIAYSKINHTPVLFAGEFVAVIDNYTWKASLFLYSMIRRVSGNIYIIGSDRLDELKTIEIGATGIIVKSIIDTWNLGTSWDSNYTYHLDKVTSNLFMFSYMAYPALSALTQITFNVANDGTITKSVLDSELIASWVNIVETNQGVAKVADGFYAVLTTRWYYGTVWNYAKLISVDGLGAIELIDELTFEAAPATLGGFSFIPILTGLSSMFVAVYLHGTAYRIRTFDISLSTITNKSYLEVSTAPDSPTVYSFAAESCVLGGFNGIVFSWQTQGGTYETHLVTAAIDGAGNITKIDQVDTGDVGLYYGTSIRRITGNYYLYSHADKLRIFTVSSAGVISLVDSGTLPVPVLYPDLIELSTGYWAVTGFRLNTGVIYTFRLQ